MKSPMEIICSERKLVSRMHIRIIAERDHLYGCGIGLNVPVSVSNGMGGPRYRAALSDYQIRKAHRYVRDDDFWIDLGERDMFRHKGEFFFDEILWWGGVR